MGRSVTFCPFLVFFYIPHGSLVASSGKLKLKITELKTPKQAQNAPSIYSVFSLIHDGKILADHYISNTRFNNIIKKG